MRKGSRDLAWHVLRMRVRAWQVLRMRVRAWHVLRMRVRINSYKFTMIQELELEECSKWEHVCVPLLTEIEND
jgi:hypothetical protein